MIRKAFVLTVLTLVMGMHLSACSSSGGKDDTSVAESNDETFAEEGAGDFADSTQAPAGDAAAAPTDTAATDATAKPDDTGADLSLGSDTPPAEATAANGDASGLPAETPPADTAAAPTDVAAADIKAADDGGLSLDSADALPADTAGTTPPPVENITENPAAPTDAGVFEAPKPAETAAVAEAPTNPVDTAQPAETSAPEPVADAKPARSPKHSFSGGGAVSYAPLMKVKESPFTGPGGSTLNRVYIARPKDTSKSIATKIYSDPKRSKDLVKWNPVLKRGARAGDKVYYASAANPSDSKMMNFYDEAGVAPQTYISKDGDNLRTVSKTLLGFNEAWKEVWETNSSVDSKGKIPAGLSITYWPNANVAAPVQTMAANVTPGSSSGGLPTTLPEAAPQIPPQAQIPPAAQGSADPFNAPPPGAMPPGQQVADNGQGPDPMAPPAPNVAAEQSQGARPPVAAGTAGVPTQNNQAPPPPPVSAVAPAKSTKKAAKEAAPADEGGMDADTTMALGFGGALLLAAAILFVVIRKNRAKRMDLGQTQV